VRVRLVKCSSAAAPGHSAFACLVFIALVLLTLHPWRQSGEELGRNGRSAGKAGESSPGERPRLQDTGPERRAAEAIAPSGRRARALRRQRLDGRRSQRWRWRRVDHWRRERGATDVAVAVPRSGGAVPKPSGEPGRSEPVPQASERGGSPPSPPRDDTSAGPDDEPSRGGERSTAERGEPPAGGRERSSTSAPSDQGERRGATLVSSRGSVGGESAAGWLGTSTPPSTADTDSEPVCTEAHPASWSFGWGSFGVGVWPSVCWRPFSDRSPFNMTFRAA
jgi:hypothetical protein